MLAAGTTATCSFQGFLLHVGFASFGYNAMLLMYYILIVRYNIKDEAIRARGIETVFLVVPGLYYIVTGILGLVWTVFNPNGAYCDVDPFPPFCTEFPDEILPCLRGEDYFQFFNDWLSIVPMFVWTTIILLASMTLAVTVLQRYFASQRFRFRSSAFRNTAQEEQTMEVVTQCLLFATSFVNVTIWATINDVWSLWIGKTFDPFGDQFWILVMVMVFVPIQGLWNFIFFIRPRYFAIRRKQARERDSQRAGGPPTWFQTSLESQDASIPSDSRNSNRERRDIYEWGRLTAIYEAIWLPTPPGSTSTSSSGNSRRGGAMPSNQRQQNSHQSRATQDNTSYTHGDSRTSSEENGKSSDEVIAEQVLHKTADEEPTPNTPERHENTQPVYSV